MKFLGCIGIILTLALTCMAGLGWHVFSLNLLAAPTATTLAYAAMWALVFILLCITAVEPNGISSTLLVLIGVWFIWHTFAHHAPGTAAGLAKASGYADRKILERATRMTLEVQHRIPCNSRNWQRFDWFAADGENGQRVPLMRYAQIDDQLWCYSGDGYDPLYGHKTEPVTEQIVRRIALQEPPVAATTPTPQPSPTPAPKWGQEQIIFVNN
jgi:hypothetical protein